MNKFKVTVRSASSGRTATGTSLETWEKSSRQIECKSRFYKIEGE